MFLWAAVLLLPILVSGCSKINISGNQIHVTDVEKLNIGDTIERVKSVLGSPTYIHKHQSLQYIYIQETLRARPVVQDEFINLESVVVTFQDGLVSEVAFVPQAKPDDSVPKFHKKTIIKGNDINPVKQIIGNIGKYNNKADPQGL